MKDELKYFTNRTDKYFISVWQERSRTSISLGHRCIDSDYSESNFRFEKQTFFSEQKIWEILERFIADMQKEKYKSVSKSTIHFRINKDYCYRLRSFYPSPNGDFVRGNFLEIDRIDVDIRSNEFCIQDAAEHTKRVDSFIELAKEVMENLDWQKEIF